LAKSGKIAPCHFHFKSFIQLNYALFGGLRVLLNDILSLIRSLRSSATP